MEFWEWQSNGPTFFFSWTVGVRVFALASAGQYLRGFVINARDSVLKIRLDNGEYVDHDYKSNPKAVIRDELPSESELANGKRVIAASTPFTNNSYYPGVIVSYVTGGMRRYNVRFDHHHGNRGVFKGFYYYIRIVPGQWKSPSKQVR